MHQKESWAYSAGKPHEKREVLHLCGGKRGKKDDATVFVGHHFTHTCNNTHEELCEELGKYGILVSYDGMSFEL